MSKTVPTNWLKTCANVGFLGFLLVVTAGGCGDDFERHELVGSDSAAIDVASDVGAAPDSTAGSDGQATDSVTIPPDSSGPTGGGGFPGTDNVCKNASDCGDAPAACVAWVCAQGACQLANQPDGTGCDDGEKCTESDACAAGVCKAGKNTCTCNVTEDCASKEDGDICNGTLFCNTQLETPACEVNPNTVIKCDDKADTTCAVNTCDPKSGKCAVAPTKDGTKCDDGKECSTDDACAAGKCVGKLSKCECTKSADCASKEDGDACNGTLYCKRSVFPFKCEVNPSTIVVCQTVDDTVCAQNKCDGKTLKCGFVHAKDGTTCDDGNPCSEGDGCKTGVCASGKNVCGCQANSDCTKHEDGSACNGTLFCDKTKSPFSCEVNPATVVTCQKDGDSACSKNLCDEKTVTCKMTPVAEGKVCEDGNVCTVEDKCVAGTCEPGKNGCDCTSDAQCAQFDDDNPCNGTLYCDKSKPPFACAVLEKSVIKCQGGDNTECLVEECVPEKGGCQMVPKNEGQSCNADDNACTANDVCQSGICKPGTNQCACKTDADCASKDDGNLCNGTLYCDKSGSQAACKVKPLSEVQCFTDVEKPCQVFQCDEKTGKCGFSDESDDWPCDLDDKACTADTCKSGTCLPGTDSCGCNVDADCAAHDDGNKCNGSLKCMQVGADKKCQVDPATLPNCATETQGCVGVTCEEKTGKCQSIVKAEGDTCDDGDTCSANDWCDKQGDCQPGTWLCGCKGDGDCQQYDDKNKCNGGYFCDKTEQFAVCKPKAPVACPKKENQCRSNQCDPIDGLCKMSVDLSKTGTECDDGDVCSAKSVCSGGQCVLQVPTQCPQNDPCVLWLCKPGTGCVKGPPTGGVNVPCDDNNPCTAGDSCKGDKCVGGPPAKCPEDKDPCQPWACQPATGCFKLPPKNAGPCDDGNPCVVSTVCTNGVCGGGVGKPCKNGPGPCLKGACDAKTGNCVSENAKDGTQCTDNKPCTKDDACKSGECVGVSIGKCNDGNVCTQDSCGTGACVYKNVQDGTKCGTANKCVTGTCSGGKCKSVPAVKCDDKNPCTNDACVATSGLCKFTPMKEGSQCDDGNPCTPKSACAAKNQVMTCVGVGGCVASGKCMTAYCDAKLGCKEEKLNCDDSNPCTKDGCNPSSGCEYKKANPCDDKNSCTADVCTLGGCEYTPVTDGTQCNDNKDKCNAGSCGKSDCGLGVKEYNTKTSGKPTIFEGIATSNRAAYRRIFVVGSGNDNGKDVAWLAMLNTSGKVQAEIGEKVAGGKIFGVATTTGNTGVGNRVCYAGRAESGSGQTRRPFIGYAYAQGNKFIGASNSVLNIDAGVLEAQLGAVVAPPKQTPDKGWCIAVGEQLQKASGEFEGVVIAYGTDSKVVASRVLKSTGSVSLRGVAEVGGEVFVGGDITLQKIGGGPPPPFYGFVGRYDATLKKKRWEVTDKVDGEEVFTAIAAQAKTDGHLFACGQRMKGTTQYPVIKRFAQKDGKITASWEPKSTVEAEFTHIVVDEEANDVFVSGRQGSSGGIEVGLIGRLGFGLNQKWLNLYDKDGPTHLWGVALEGEAVLGAGRDDANNDMRAVLYRVAREHGGQYCGDKK